jgi:hypothetical protein
MAKRKEKKEETDPVIRKITKMYENYGMDISNMSEEEFERIKQLYRNTNKADLDADLKKSEKFKDRFADDIM